jgi:hypothetical protein
LGYIALFKARSKMILPAYSTNDAGMALLRSHGSEFGDIAAGVAGTDASTEGCKPLNTRLTLAHHSLREL